MNTIRLIARDELRLMARNRVAVIAFLLLVALTSVAVISSWSHQRGIAELRGRHADAAQTAFDAQPDRHPHRVVHYGTFLFRPLGPLAAFDPGVDAFTGNSMFLEGHRQNTANFGDVRQSSSLIRFGQLTPAFVLQMVAPLLLIFLGFSAVARETERGTLSVLMMQGVSRGQVMKGKLLALGALALLAGLPAVIGFVLIAAEPGSLALPILTIALGYFCYLSLWVLAILLISASVRRSRDALLALVGIWAVVVVLFPRVAPAVASAAVPLESRLQTDIAIARDLREMGDSHNPDDPHFAEFKQSVLDRYGVTRVEDLPVNYEGVLGMEGERLTSALFDRYAAISYDAQARQNSLVQAAGLVSPVIALRSLSMAAAGTGFAGHRRFLDQAEAYRYDLVQGLNELQADKVSFADDTASDPDADRRSRVSSSHWRQMPDFVFVAPTGVELAGDALPGLTIVLAWVAMLAWLLTRVTQRLGVRQ